MLGSLQSEAAWCRHMCNKANIKVIDVDYRMGPEHKFPAAIYDCWDAVKWVKVSCLGTNKVSGLTLTQDYQQYQHHQHRPSKRLLRRSLRGRPDVGSAGTLCS